MKHLFASAVVAVASIFALVIAAEGQSKPASRPTSKPTSAPVYSAWPFDAKEAAKRQDETAKALGIEKEITLDLGNKVAMKLVLIPPGKFMMGSPKEEHERFVADAVAAGFAAEMLAKDDGPQHEVTISKPYYIGVRHVTRGQFAAFATDSGHKTGAEEQGIAWGWNGSEFALMSGYSWRKTGFEQTDDHPVVNVSYSDAIAFCDWMGKKAGKTVSLPTEAQWEYACRAGTITAYQWGDSADDGKGWCNVADQTAKKQLPMLAVSSCDDGYVFTSPVGKFKPNAFGLFDMHGNVWQWCGDWYERDYYSKSGNTDPQGPSTGRLRVLRGGSWSFVPCFCRSAYRKWQRPDDFGDAFGFRVVVEVAAPEASSQPGAR